MSSFSSDQSPFFERFIMKCSHDSCLVAFWELFPWSFVAAWPSTDGTRTKCLYTMRLGMSNLIFTLKEVFDLRYRFSGNWTEAYLG